MSDQKVQKTGVSLMAATGTSSVLMPAVSVESSERPTDSFMAPSVVDHSVAPPGYSSQVDAATHLQSSDPTSGDHELADELVSTQTHSQTHAASISSAQATPRQSDVHFNDGTPTIQRSRTVASRRRYFSLPYGGSTVTFPVHLSYHPSNNPSTTDVTMPEREFEQELPVLGNPSMQHLHEKLTSGPPASRGSTIRLNPANYILLSRKGTPKRFFALSHTSSSIKGKFTVNPFLHVPAALLSPGSLPSGRDRDAAENVRKNLKLEVENGGIDVEIFLIGESDPDLDSGVRDADNAVLRTTLDLKIRHGASLKNKFPLVAKIHTPTTQRPPFHLTASAQDGYLSLHLPPSFHGLLTVTVKLNHGPIHNLPLDAHVSLSAAFFQNSMILSESGLTRSYFVGEMGGWGREEQGWGGDRVDVTLGRGLVRLQMLGEKNKDTVRRIRWKLGI